jgi:hypothetical protein
MTVSVTVLFDVLNLDRMILLLTGSHPNNDLVALGDIIIPTPLV